VTYDSSLKSYLLKCTPAKVTRTFKSKCRITHSVCC